MKFIALLASLHILSLLAPSAGEVFFEEKFESEEWEKRWVHSEWKGGNGPASKFQWSAGKWSADEQAQKGLRTEKDMHYHSISSKFAKPFSNKGKDLVLQFSVKHEAQEFTFCGGGYIKLMPSEFDQVKFGGDTPYHIMFGPDICGYDVERIHLIFNYKGENLLRNENIKLGYDNKNAFTHLYTLVLKPDNTYKVYLDLKEMSSGSLHDHWNFPNKTFDDPADKIPADWVTAQKITDPKVNKPDTWVDEERIRDPDAPKPAEWDDDEDGTYEAPMIKNPKYKGAWVQPMIDNPEYKGEWSAKTIDNPAYVQDVYPYDDIGAVGFELWTVNKDSIFDNILVTDSWEHAKKVGEEAKKIMDKEKDAKKAYDKANGKDPADSAPPAGAGEDDDDDVDTVDLDKKEKSEL